jgi:hypothetical protein
MVYTREARNGYGTWLHDWGTYELESMKNCLSFSLSLSVYVFRIVFCDPIVAGQHECQADVPH